MTLITIEFESNDYDEYFIKDLKDSIRFSKWKPHDLTLNVKEKFN